MASKIMPRAFPVRFCVLVVLSLVLTQALYAVVTLILVKPASVKHLAYSLDAVLDRKIRNYPERLKTEVMR
jgi:hypothetical protein